MKKIIITTLCAMTLAACGQKSSEEYINSGKTLIAQQDVKAAIIEFKNAVKTEPQNAEARFLLGKAYLDNRQYDFAQKEFERALEFKYSPEKLIPLLSETYQKTGADKALLELELGQSSSAEEVAKVKFFQLQAHMRLGQNDKAHTLVNEIQNLNTESPYKPLALVIDLMLKEQPDAAHIQLDNIMESYPNQPDALKFKAGLLLSEKKFQDAAGIYQIYVDNNPDDLDMTFVLARLYNDINRFDKSEPLVDQLLAVNDKQPVLNQLKAIARMQDKDYASALTYAEKALSVQVEDVAVRLIAGVSAYFQEDYATANQHLSLIVGSLPSSHPGLRMLAESQLKLGMTLEANDTMQQFDKITEQEATLVSGIGQALLREGDVKQARSLLAKQPEELQSPKALANVGLLKLSLNDVDGILDLESALSSVKNDQNNAVDATPIEDILVKAYLSTQQYDKAMNIANQWKTSNDNAVKGFMLAGAIYMQQENVGAAKSSFVAALNQEPDSPRIKMAILSLEPSTTAEEQKAHLESLKGLMQEHPDYVPAILRQYLLEKRLEMPISVIQQLSTLIQNNPENQVYPVLLGQIYTVEQRPEDAITQFESVKTDTPQPFWQALSKAYQKTKQFEKFVNLNKTWLEKQPNNPRAILGNAIALESRGNSQQALELTNKYVNELEGSRVELVLMHIHLLLKNQEFEKAQAQYNKLNERAKALPFARGLLAQLQLKSNNPKLAQVNLEAAYAAHATPQNARLMYQILEKTKGPQPAYQFLQQHVQRNKNDQASIMRLANLQLSLNKDLAIQNYQAAIVLNENNFVAHNNLAYLYMEKESLEQALEHAEKANQIRPADVNVLDTLGAIQLKRGKQELALEHFKIAIENMDDNINDVIYVNYIEALLANGQTTLAKRKMEQHKVNDDRAKSKLAELESKYF